MVATRLIGLLFVFGIVGRAQDDPRLGALHKTLEALHAQTHVSAINRGEGPNLTRAKHQLRDWIESRLDSAGSAVDPLKLSPRINAALKRISIHSDKDEQNLLGSLGQVELNWSSGLLTVITQIGILCQHDASAYVYEQVNGKWNRIWESEQDDYLHYKPQYISAVHVWRSNPNGNPGEPVYILTLGNEWGCESAWHTVYYRIWRVNAADSKLLVDQSGFAYLRSRGYIAGSIAKSAPDFSGPVDAFIEFTQFGGDAGLREAVRHFSIEGDRVRRVDPVALSPRDFIHEWMSQPWSQSSEWSSSSPELRAWHKKLHVDLVTGSFLETTKHCQTPDLWQVDFMPSSSNKNVVAGQDLYFQIRWTPPYRFTLVDVSVQPWPGCTQPDPEADAWRTLFSSQGWRDQ